MNDRKTSDTDFLQSLLEQETLLQNPTFDANRRQLLERLLRARRFERAARWITISIAAVAFTVFGFLYAAAMNKFGNAPAWPYWLKYVAMLAMILLPFGALLLAGIYVFRHVRELSRAREAVHQAAFAEVVRQVGDLRRAQPTLPPPPTGPVPRP